jgi:hypothetical protein
MHFTREDTAHRGHSLHSVISNYICGFSNTKSLIKPCVKISYSLNPANDDHTYCGILLYYVDFGIVT